MIRFLPTMLVLLCPVVCPAQPAEMEVRFDGTTSLSWVSGHRIAIEWLEVNDSRCPKDAVCVWEGEVAVRLGVSTDGDEVEEVLLTRHHDGDERATTEVAGYGLRLAGVDPYPTLAAPPERGQYLARLLVAPPGSEMPVETAVQQRTWGQVKREGSPGA